MEPRTVTAAYRRPKYRTIESRSRIQCEWRTLQVDKDVSVRSEKRDELLCPLFVLLDVHVEHGGDRAGGLLTGARGGQAPRAFSSFMASSIGALRFSFDDF